MAAKIAPRKNSKPDVTPSADGVKPDEKLPVDEKKHEKKPADDENSDHHEPGASGTPIVSDCEMRDKDPDVPNRDPRAGKRQRADSTAPTTPVVEHLEFPVEMKPDKIKQKEEVYLRAASGLSNNDARGMKQAQTHMWTALTARMDHTDQLNAKNLEKIAYQFKSQATKMDFKFEQHDRKLEEVDNKLYALEGQVKTGFASMESAINALGVRLSANGASVQAPPNVHANGASVQAPPNVPTASVQYPGGNNSLFVRGFPKKMIARDIVSELEGMCKTLSDSHAQQGKPSLAQPAEIRIWASRPEML